MVDFSADRVITHLMKLEFVRRLYALRTGKHRVSEQRVAFRDVRSIFPDLNEKTLSAYWKGESLPSDAAWAAIMKNLHSAGFDTAQFLTGSPIFQELVKYGTPKCSKKSKKETNDGPSIFDFGLGSNDSATTTTTTSSGCGA